MSQPVYPKVGEVITKLWGTTVCTSDHGYMDVWEASIVAGGYSSRHYHEHKTNVFRVKAGVLRIEEWYGSSPKGPPHIVKDVPAGQRYSVGPKVWHRFVALTDVELTEVYTHTDGVPLIDIVRYDEGGVDPKFAEKGLPDG